MVNSLWLATNGSQVEIEFMNAFFVSNSIIVVSHVLILLIISFVSQSEKTETLDIRSFGYLQPSRVYNVDNFRYQQTRDLYINLERNMYHDEDYREAIKALLSGKHIDTSDRIDRIYTDSVRSKSEEKQRKAEARAKKVKRRI